MAAPAGPVVVEGGALAAITGALILACLAWATLFGLQQFYTYTFGALLHGLKNLLNLPFGIHIGDATAGKVDAFVQAQIGRALSAAETSVSRTWYALGWVARETAHTVEFLAHSTLDAIEGLTRSTIPEQVAGRITPNLTKLYLNLAALGLTVAALKLDLYARVGALEQDMGRLFGRAWQGIDKVKADARAQAKAIGGSVAAELGALNRYAHGALNHRLTRLEKIAAGTALTAAIVGTVSRFAPWWRCSNVGRAGKAICRLDPSALENLLAGLLLIFGTISLLDLARGMQEITGEVTDAARFFIREARALDDGSVPPPQVFGLEGKGAPVPLGYGVTAAAQVFGLEA